MGTELVQKQIYISQKDLFRLAASLYSETSDVFDADDSLLLMIECLFLENENDFFMNLSLAVRIYLLRQVGK